MTIAMKSRITSHLIWAVIFGLFAGSLLIPDPRLANIGRLAIWIYAAIALAITPFLFVIAAEANSGSEKHIKIAEGLQGRIKKQTLLGKLKLMLLVGIVAYAGYLFTAITLLASIMLMFLSARLVEFALDKNK